MMIKIPKSDYALCCCTVGHEQLDPVVRLDGDYAIQPEIVNESWIPKGIITRLKSYPTVDMKSEDFP